ncbi:MAG: hypothetical protein V5B33_00060 [Candidatus Accumulibacter sp. UW20]|jgi:hypothetical protein
MPAPSHRKKLVLDAKGKRKQTRKNSAAVRQRDYGALDVSASVGRIRHLLEDRGRRKLTEKHMTTPAPEGHDRTPVGCVVQLGTQRSAALKPSTAGMVHSRAQVTVLDLYEAPYDPA